MPLLNSTHGGLHTVIYEGGIVCHRVPRESAIVALHAAFPDAPESVLDQPADPAEFRTLWAAATAAEIDSLHTELGDLITNEATTTAELEALKARQATLAKALAEDHAEKQRRKADELEQRINAAYERLIAALARDNGISDSEARNTYSQQVWQHLRANHGTWFYELHRLRGAR